MRHENNRFHTKRKDSWDLYTPLYIEAGMFYFINFYKYLIRVISFLFKQSDYSGTEDFLKRIDRNYIAAETDGKN